MFCELCGKDVARSCAPRASELKTVPKPREPEAIKDCTNFQEVCAQPRGQNGGLMRRTVEADRDYDLISQEGVRELSIDEVRRFVPDFELRAA